MIAVENKQTDQEVVVTAAQGGSEPVVWFANGVGVTYREDNDIAKNPVLLDFLGELDAEAIAREDGYVSFPVDHRQLTHFLHMVYCNASEGKKIQVYFDGTYPIQEAGMVYNAQLVTISEVAE